MAISTIQLVDTDLSTVLFDLHSADGSTNSSWGSVITKFGLGGSFKVEAPHDAERFQHPSLDGAFTTFSRRGLGTATWRQVVTGSSEANLRLGVGRLTDLVTRGGILRIVTGTTTRYLRFEPSPYPQPFQGKEIELHNIYQAFAFRDGLDITLACQPYWEGAEVTSSSVTVPNDPATSTKVRVFPITVTGDLPTSAKVRVQVAADSRTLSTSAAADDIIDCTGHGFQVGDAIVFTSLTGGSGLSVGTIYFVTTTSFGANTFRVALTPGGTDINFTTDITAGAAQIAGTVERILVASRPRNTNASSYFADYLSDTGYLNCESSGRNWTITLGTETTSQPDTEASGGNAARCTHVTTPTLMQRRVRATRTAALDSLRGSWDVYLRVRNNGVAPDEASYHQLRWGPATSDPAPFSEEPVTLMLTTGALGTNYTEQNLGTIHIPKDSAVALGGLALEVWSAADSAMTEYFDILWLVPHDNQGTIVVPEGSTTITNGADLLTAVSNPAGGTSGTPVGTTLKLDTTTDNAGVGGTGGIVYAAGRYRVTWRVQVSGIASGSTETIDYVIRNVTGSSNVYAMTRGYGNGEKVWTADFQADGTTAYQAQVDNPSAANKFFIQSITVQSLPMIARTEMAQTDPLRYAVDKLDNSGNLLSYLGNEGQVMAVLDPGDNHVMVRCDEVPAPGNTVNENKLERTPTVTISYFPRYPF